jgi:hypothetical protein
MKRYFSIALALWLAVGGCSIWAADHVVKQGSPHHDCCPKDAPSENTVDRSCCAAIKAEAAAAVALPALSVDVAFAAPLAVLFEHVAPRPAINQRSLYLAIRVLRI